MFSKSVNVVELDNPFTPKGATPSIIGSCNGLLCINISVKGFSTIFIWNPTTRRVNRLPSCGEFSNEHIGSRYRFVRYYNPFVGFSFGYDESNDDYKVVAIILDEFSNEHGVKTIVKIYSLKSGYWKTLDCDLSCGHPRHVPGIFSNGALHWIIGDTYSPLSDRLWTIASFDLATETSGEILQPVYDDGRYFLTLSTTIFDKSLSVVCCYHGNNRSRWDVWVMEVYGEQNSWFKMASIPHPRNITMVPQYFITSDENFLMKVDKVLVMWDPENDPLSKKMLKIDTDSSRLHTFVESLVSPMPMPMPMPGRSRDTHGFFNSIILRFKKIWS